MKRIVSVGLLWLVLVGLLSGCSALQPTRKRLAETNSFSEGSYTVDVHIDLIDSDLTMYYDSSVHATKEQTEWDGVATVYFKEHYFYQMCNTVCSERASYKRWRGDHWVVSDTKPLLSQILLWQEFSAAGLGTYETAPLPPSYYTEALSEEGGTVYAITMLGIPLQWNALCDIHLDTLFGTNTRLDNVPEADVTLLYDTETYGLRYVILSKLDEDTYFSALLTIYEEPYDPDIQISEIVPVTGYLSEEWSFSKEASE